jgi:hypothetical protein
VVVYQLGKVASTALVSTLSQFPGVIAVQSHFLGLETFSSMLGLIINDFSDYTANHALGQLRENISIERTINAVRSGEHPGVALTILSLAREPLDWFRSAIIQDIGGYCVGLREIANVQADRPDEEAIAKGLPAVCEEIVSFLEATDGIDASLGRELSGRNEPRRQHFDARNGIVGELFSLFLRPYMWFELHFARYIGVSVEELPMIAPQVYRGDLGSGARTYVIRYEDIAASVPLVLEDIGISDTFRLTRENISQDKQLATAVLDGIAAAPLDRLRAQSNASSYARQFDYVE